LIQSGQATIPVAFFTLKCERERLEPGHSGHLLDAVDEQGGPSTAQKEDERSRLWLQPKMNGGIDDIEGAVSPADAMTDFAHIAFGKVARHAGDVVDAAHFLYRRGGDGKGLSADTKQNDLLGSRLGRSVGLGKIHHRAPTGVARVNASTRLSIAA
jgi:hypothetical protein